MNRSKRLKSCSDLIHRIFGFLDQYRPAALDTARVGALRFHSLHLYFRPVPDLRPFFRWLKWVLPCSLLLLLAILEIRTSALQSRLISYYAHRMSYTIASGPSRSILFPKVGPFNQRRGYTRIPMFVRRLEQHQFEIMEQARFSPQLESIVRWGVAPPYREPGSATLTILGKDGESLYKPSPANRLFHRYEDIPVLLIQTLLLMENRELAKDGYFSENPVVEWDRLLKAGLLYAGNRLGLPLRVEGGSTLATQLEKYRHSPEGRSRSLGNKIQQMVGASLKVYRNGLDTRLPRREIILDYLNTVPLSAAPGYGEVQGLGEGLHAWFGEDLENVCLVLKASKGMERTIAFKKVLMLLAAVRKPTHYLLKDPAALQARVDYYIVNLERRGIIDFDFARSLESAHVELLSRAPDPQAGFLPRRKAADSIRRELLGLLGVANYYDLDRLHLDVVSTIDVVLQEKAHELFANLRNPQFVQAQHLREERLLLRGDPAKVLYSLLLIERTPQGNFERVHLDSVDRSFDVNEGMKLPLGSTAKLRTLIHYLEVIGELYKELQPLAVEDLRLRAHSAKDPLTRWVAGTLAEQRLDQRAMLHRALDRTYSASPYETFFTGGGVHRFSNFDEKDNSRKLTVREATRRSVNLVYIRLMRDLVSYHQARLPYDTDQVLADPHHPMRRSLLADMVNQEGEAILFRSHEKYKELAREEKIARFLGTRARSSHALSILYFAWQRELKPGAPSGGISLAQWLRKQLGEVREQEIANLERAYGNPRLNLLDYAYLLKKSPLELFCAGAMFENPALTLNELWVSSRTARQQAASWLFETRNRDAQDRRLRIRIEQDAFARMTPYWRRLGFPFKELIPSYATAIGDSSDRPSALAEMMGILVNDGIRMPMTRIRELRLAPGTPYHTVLGPIPTGEQVLDASVARELLPLLAEVVEDGTARRVAGAFNRPDGRAVVVGGKTGSGDNRFKTFGRGGDIISSRSVNRTAAFVFYIGKRYFGVMVAYVPGQEAEEYGFTSALPVAILKLLSPSINQSLGNRRDQEPGA